MEDAVYNWRINNYYASAKDCYQRCRASMQGIHFIWHRGPTTKQRRTEPIASALEYKIFCFLAVRHEHYTCPGVILHKKSTVRQTVLPFSLRYHIMMSSGLLLLGSSLPAASLRVDEPQSDALNVSRRQTFGIVNTQVIGVV